MLLKANVFINLIILFIGKKDKTQNLIIIVIKKMFR